MEKIYVIYGASGGGQKVAKTLESFNIDIHCFIDTDSSLWGDTILGKKVYPPEYVLNKECGIIIASDAGYSAIKDKLRLIGKDDACILKEELLLPKVQEMIAELHLEDNTNGNNVREENKKLYNNIFLELIEGYQLGGIENWSYIVAKGLKSKNLDAKILCKKVENTPLDWKDIIYDEFDGDFLNYKKCVLEIFEYLKSNLPCTLLLNKHQQVMYAGYLLKQLYPDQVKIFSIIHSDLESIYDRHTYMDDMIDGYMCVSNKLKNVLKNKYYISEDKLFYKESPVVFDINNLEFKIIRNNSSNRNEPVHIAYGARIEKITKRADLIIPLIEELESRNCNYIFDIAGEGTYLPILKDFVKEHSLQNKVKFYGKIKHEDMIKFWCNADIFVGLSETEGVSLSVLEALACGTVAVMFEVAGCDEFINNGTNGYIIPYEDYVSIADKIEYLNNNRHLLPVMGEYSIKLIKEKCKLEDYISYLIDMIYGF